MQKKYILSLDQGTTSSRAILFDHEQNMISSVSREFPQIYPKEGWVEHNPDDILSCDVLRPKICETTALGAAYLAGLAVGFWSSCEELSQSWQCDSVFTPKITDDNRALLIAGWRRAVERTLEK